MVKKVKLATALSKSRDRHIENTSGRGVNRSARAKPSGALAVAPGSPQAGAREPGARNVLGKAVYGALYYASYGIVYTALMVLSYVPRGSAVDKGIHDGHRAARDAFAACSRTNVTGEPAGEPASLAPPDQAVPA